MRVFMRIFALLAAVCITSFPAHAQMTPEQAMAQVAASLQVGGMNWSRFAPPVYQAVWQQTGGSGIYPQLRELGVIQNVIRLNGVQLPGGFIYVFRVFFQFGAVDFQIASDNFGNVLQLSFRGSPPSMQPTLPPPTTSGPDDPPTAPTKATPVAGGGAKPISVPSTADEGCSLYPQLCE